MGSFVINLLFSCYSFKQGYSIYLFLKSLFNLLAGLLFFCPACFHNTVDLNILILPKCCKVGHRNLLSRLEGSSTYYFLMFLLTGCITKIFTPPRAQSKRTRKKTKILL